MATASAQEAGQTPGRLNLRMVQGGSFALPFTVKASGVAVPLGGTILAEIRDTDGVLAATFDVATGSDLANGLIQLNLTDAQTAGLDLCSTYFYDVVNIDAPTTVYYLTGCVLLVPARSDPP